MERRKDEKTKRRKDEKTKRRKDEKTKRRKDGKTKDERRRDFKRVLIKPKPSTSTMILLDPVAVFKYGIRKAGHPVWVQDSLDKMTKLDGERFREAFGISPSTVATVFVDIQNIEIMEEESMKNPKLCDMMMALRWLRVYDKEKNHAGFWNMCENSARTKTWKYVKAFQTLVKYNVKWVASDPENLPEEVFIASVDGVHCRISEIRTNPSKDICSYKDKHPGLVYELGIAVYKDSLVWINGPFPAGWSDLKVFRAGLKDAVPDGKRLIADQGYVGEPGICSTRNPLDTAAVKELKKRAKARHETFNKRLKSWDILSSRFRCTRDPIPKHKVVFEACCVLTQYDVEDNHPLFKV